jgi:peptidyl-prolyl cis-trans isomerase SurA
MTRALVLLPIVLLAAGGARAQTEGEVIDGTAAVVGDEAILQSEVADAVRRALAQLQRQQVHITPELIVEVRDQALHGLIDSKLILQIARDNRLEPTDEEIDLSVQGIADDEGIDVETIYEAAAQQGLSRSEYREQLGIELSKMKVMTGSVAGRVSVSDEEIRELYDERYGSLDPGERFRVLHILLPWPPAATAADWQQTWGAAREIREQALDTGQFAALARRYSAGPTAAGGGLTVFKQSDAPPAVAAALEKLSPGEISPVIETAHGLNLFQFLDSFDPSSLSYEDLADGLRAELRERKTFPEFEKWLAELKRNRYIEILGARRQ